MPALLADVLDAALLDEMLASRFVKRQVHPSDPTLEIYNYTQLAQFNRVWNPVTLACRGLVVREGVVIARPFAKFFNLAEHQGESLPDGPVHVTEKLDGSLGILVPFGAGHVIATRGSFASDQAIHATAVWSDRYAPVFTPNPDWTYLFEIVYPANRVVVDYAGADDLFLLGAIDTATGTSVPLADARKDWPGPVVPELPYTSVEETLAAPERDGAEGYVIHFLDADLRVKLKHAEYVRLHRIITGVSERRVWEALADGIDLAPWLEAVPDECFAFVTGTRDRLLAEHAALIASWQQAQRALVATLPDGWGRREYAQAASAAGDRTLASALFCLLDGKDPAPLAWRQIRPENTAPMWSGSEDNT